MRLLLVMILILSSAIEAIACGLQSTSSLQNILQIAQQTSSKSTVDLPKVLINGGSNLVIKNTNGLKVRIDENLVLTPGMTVTTASGKTQLFILATGQTIELWPQSTLIVSSYNKSADQKICSLSFKMQSGTADFTSDHQGRLKDCLPQGKDMHEVATNLIEITPVGTKYNVDLNRAIAELNGEKYESEENVSVKKGAVQIRLVKLKKPNKTFVKSKMKKNSLVSNDDAEYEEKPVLIKAGRKAKIKKRKKDRMADIQIVYPEQ